jgi:penicillin-binding protein 1A
MQGVIQKGTGRSMYSYAVPTQSIAGKTGTTNDNSDLWFMGYTPQLLAGAWVGCDDRYIRFSDNYFGQGAHASLPIWANFMSKVAADPACNLDANASFERPSSMLNDFNIDFISKDSTGLEGMDDIINTEDIKAESDYTLPDAEIASPVKNTAPNKTTPPIKNNSKDTKSKDTKANKEGAKPKALFPPKKN